MAQGNPDLEPYNALRALIEGAENRENECREYLQYAPGLLVKEAIVELKYFETDYRGHTGDSDYVISARVQDPAGTKPVVAYVWELKAPQCYIFRKTSYRESRIK